MGNDEWARVPMQTSAWIASCLEVWPGDVEQIEVEGGLAVLARRRGALELIGRELSEPSDVLWRDKDAGARIADRLRRKPLVLRGARPTCAVRGAGRRHSRGAARDDCAGARRRRRGARARRRGRGLGLEAAGGNLAHP